MGLKLSFKDRNRCAAFNLKWKQFPEVWVCALATPVEVG